MLTLIDLRITELTIDINWIDMIILSNLYLRYIPNRKVLVSGTSTLSLDRIGLSKLSMVYTPLCVLLDNIYLL